MVELARLAPPFAVALRERHQEPVLLRRMGPLAHNVSSPQRTRIARNLGLLTGLAYSQHSRLRPCGSQ